ncbi:MAG: pyridoxal phosphate-dependent aminotransferase [Bdellovibrionales bacterium]|jgi:aspartate aminotransferase|nr:pyridoxal phosphate-dependent aminotransferase [Bdellovibrionales bacterium]MBL7687276.1 pyridoxal phosphate-dependent aminotransferase [Pseudobdellovibrionaceae bacterium]
MTGTTQQPIQLAERAKLLKPSPILMLAARAGEMKAAGQDVISLSIGEPDWGTYECIKTAAIESIKKGQTKYTPPAGIPELRRAVAAQATEDYGMPFAFDEVTVSGGAKFVLFAALQALVNPGDEVILVAPFWASYTTMVELADGKPRIAVCDETSDFKLTPALLERTITPKTKVLLLNSPSNPTGKIYTREELKALAEVLRKHPQIAIISDDIYNRLCFTEKLAPHLYHVAPDLRSRIIALNGASKSYAMTGWRLGWALGPKPIITAMSNYQSQSVSCASAPSQYGALEGVLHGDADIVKTVALLKDRRDFLIAELEKISGVKVTMPEGAFYLWVDVRKFIGAGRKAPGSAELCQMLLEEKLVAAVPGVEFGLEGYLRLSYALDKEKGREAVRRMAELFKTLA